MSAPRRRRKPAPRSHFPKTLERDYAAALKRRLRIAARSVKAELEERGKMRVDSAADDASIRGAVGRVRMAYFERYTVVDDERIAIETAGKVEGYIERQVTRQFKAVLGVDPLPSSKLQGAAREFANDNVALIRSLGSEFFEKLEADLVEAYADGGRWEQLSKVVQERYGLEAKRANLIARDQMGTLASRVAMTKQQESGAIGYRWRNSQDERVVGNPGGLYPRGNSRHGDHWSREGKFFRWSDPPHDGHPGEAINCRCTAEPVWDEEEVEGEEVATESERARPAASIPVNQANPSTLFSVRELGVIEEASRLLNEVRYLKYQGGQENGRFRETRMRNRAIGYEPSLPSGISAMTDHQRRGFTLGPQAFANEDELKKTLLQELYRLEFSESQAEGAYQALATTETKDAFTFAEHAYRAVRDPEGVD